MLGFSIKVVLDEFMQLKVSTPCPTTPPQVVCRLVCKDVWCPALYWNANIWLWHIMTTSSRGQRTSNSCCFGVFFGQGHSLHVLVAASGSDTDGNFGCLHPTTSKPVLGSQRCSYRIGGGDLRKHVDTDYLRLPLSVCKCTWTFLKTYEQNFIECCVYCMHAFLYVLCVFSPIKCQYKHIDLHL